MNSESKASATHRISAFFCSDFLLILLISILLLFYLAFINGGHNWGDDFAMYIAHARNIVTGKAYIDTGYIYNPGFPELGPQAYPPIFPLILSPLIALFGLNLWALKLAGVVSLSLFLYVFLIKIAPHRLPRVFRILLLLLIGLHPFFGEMLNNILSDIPFLLICYTTLYLFQFRSNQTERSNNVGLNMLIGFLIYLSYGTRSIGLSLLAVFFLYEWMLKRRFSKKSWIVIGVSAVGIIIQSILLPGTGSYFDQIPHTIPEALNAWQSLSRIYLGLLPKIIPISVLINQKIVLIAFFIPAIAAFINKMIHRITVYEVFFLVYSFSLLLWPSFQGLRLLLPLIPLFFLYTVEGIQLALTVITNNTVKNFSIVVITCFFVFVFYNYYVTYSHILQNPSTSDITKSSTNELFNFVRQKVSNGETCVFYKPRALALFTGCRSVAIESGSYCDVIHRLKDFDAKYYIVDLRENSEIWSEYAQSAPDTFELVFKNIDYQVFRIHYRGKCLDF
ncbi:MAG: glycosyltransferase family 39 protein [Leptolinea sp.]|nr:glycosyltransferase family 39 protein [Leptolinea sp.]